MLRFARVAVVCLVLVSLTSGVAAGAPAATPESSPPAVALSVENESTSSESHRDGNDAPVAGHASHDSPTLEATYLVNRTPARVGTVRVTYELVVPETVLNVTLAPRADFSNVTSPDFAATGNGSWHWNRSTNDTVTLALSYTAPANTTDPFGLSTVDTREWAFVSLPTVYLDVSWYYTGTAPEYRRGLAADGRGYAAADEFVYLGPYSTRTYRGPNQTFTYVRPESANPVSPASAVLENLSLAGRDLMVGGVDPSVTAFVLPSPPIRGGGRARATSLWVDEDSDLRSTVWYHEYVHTRQAYPTVTGGLAWFSEGSADYYGGYLGWKRGQLTDEEFATYLNTTRQSSAVLANLSSQYDTAAYTKGRRVLAALDGEIRAATDGRRSLEDVFRALNARTDANVTLAEFETTAESVAGRSFDDWFDRYVESDGVPPVPSISRYDRTVTAAFEASPSPVAPNESVTLDASASFASGDASLAYRWDFDGDGVTDANGSVVSHAFESTRTVTLTVEAEGGETASVSKTVQVSETGTLAGYAGEDGIIQTSDLKTVIRAWARGDVSTSDLQSAITYWVRGTPVE